MWRCWKKRKRRAGKLLPYLSTKWIRQHHKFPKSLLQVLPSQELCSQISSHFSLGTSLFLGRFWGTFLLLELKTSPNPPSSHELTWTFQFQQRSFPLRDALLGTHEFPEQPPGMPGLSASPMPGGAGFVPTLTRHSQPWKWLQCSLIGFITSDNVF